MRTETYYINELTGEVFHNEQDCRVSEQSYAETLKTNILNAYSELNNYCRGRECEKCVFYHDSVRCAACWFNEGNIKNEIKKRRGE
jgi:hypothetical protein